MHIIWLSQWTYWESSSTLNSYIWYIHFIHLQFLLCSLLFDYLKMLTEHYFLAFLTFIVTCIVFYGNWIMEVFQRSAQWQNSVSYKVASWNFTAYRLQSFYRTNKSLYLLLVENTLLVEDVKLFDTFESGEEQHYTEFLERYLVDFVYVVSVQSMLQLLINYENELKSSNLQW